MFRKTLFLILFVVLGLNICVPCGSAGMIVDFLLEIAEKYYERGNFKEALHELNKALLVEPEHQEVRRFIEKIEKEQTERIKPAREKKEIKRRKLAREKRAIEEKRAIARLERPELEAEAERKKRQQIEEEAKEREARLKMKIVEAGERKGRLELGREIEEEKRPIIAEEIPAREEELVLPEMWEPEVLEEEEKIIEVQKMPPAAKEEIAPKWVRPKPMEMITSGELEDYRLFSEVKIFINGEQIEIGPIIIKGNEICLPLEKTTQALGLVVFSPQKDTLIVISAEGLPLEFNIGKGEVLVNQKPFLVIPAPLAIYDGNVMLNLDSLQEALGISCEYFPDTNTVKITKGLQAEFSTFTIERPAPAVEEERIEKVEEPTRTEPPPPREMRKELLPREYYPDVDFKLDSSFRYFGDMFEHRRTRYIEHYLKGKMYGVDVYGHLSMRDYETDEKRTFKEDGQHLSFFKEGKGIKLLDNYIRLPGVRTQSQSYWGLELDYEAAPVKSYAWIGEMDPVYIPSPELGHSVRYFGNLYASRQDWIDRPQFRLSAVELFTHSHSEFSEHSGSTAYPSKNFVYLVDSDWQIWPQLNFYNTFAQSIYNADNERDAVVSDCDFKSAIMLDYDRFKLNSSFEYVGDRYASLGIPSTYQDYIGGDVSTNFKIKDFLTLNISGNMNRDNVAFDEGVPSSHSRGISTSANLGLPWRQNLNFGYNYNRYLTRGGLQNASGSEYNSYRINYYKTLEAASLQLGWQHYRMDPLASNTGSMFFDTYSGTIYKSFPNLGGSYLRLYQDMTKRKSLAMGNVPTTSTWNTSLSARYYLVSNLSLTGDCRVRTTQEQQAEDTSIMSFSTGADYRLSPDTSLNLTYEASNVDLRNDPSTEDWSILFYIRHIFDIKTAEKWGKVMVSVFEDLNGNDTRDEAEEGLEDVLAYVIKGRGARTDSHGRALIEKVVPGERKVSLDMRGLPVEMVIKGDPTKEVTVEPLKTQQATFIAVTTGKIAGRVFVDTDNDGTFDKGIDIPIPNVRIFLSPEYKDTLSFSDGSYRFNYAYPGRCKVNVDLEWVPKEYKIVLPETQDIEVESRETTENVDFIFQGRALKIKYF